MDWTRHRASQQREVWRLRIVALPLIGSATWFSPTMLIVLMAFIAAYPMIDGAVALAYALRLRSSFPHWWVLLIQSLISVACGVLVQGTEEEPLGGRPAGAHLPVTA